MVRVHHTIRLIGPQHDYGREAPALPVGNLLRSIEPAVRQSILMAFLGRSRPPGRPRTWLVWASDIRFVDIEAGKQGETILHFEAPRLGEAAEELCRQQESWPSRPPARDTGIDLLCDVLGDVAAHRVDSDRFDSSLLKRIEGFGKVLDRAYQGAVFAGDRYLDEQPAILDEATIANARQLTLETPPPQRVRVVGLLDMIRMSSQGFELLLDDGARPRGVLVEGDMAALKPMCGNRVLVQGSAIYRPSGRLLRIDADRIEPGDDLPGIWSVIPPPRSRKLDAREFLKPQGPASGVSAFFGKWPGDESDEEIAAYLEEIS